jgi:ABC-2 type transport system ATP-binding protein
MQRRLTLASTLVHDPELLYLDEPTAGVDPILRERFWSHFRSLRDRGNTVVVPTQYVGEAVSCDVVAVMAAGRLITLQPPDQLARFAYGGDPLLIDMDHGWVAGAEIERLRREPYVAGVDWTHNGLMVVVRDAATDVERVRAFFDTSQLPVNDVAPAEPTFDEIFVRIIETNTNAEERAVA